MLLASCHCGAVQITVLEKRDTITICNCSVCYRYGAQWMYLTSQTAIVKCTKPALSAYSWGKKNITFFHCHDCGCLTHYERNDKTQIDRIAVNARMLPQSELTEVRFRYFDGADTGSYIGE